MKKNFLSICARAFLLVFVLQPFCNSASAQNYTMTNVWTVNAGSVPYLSLSSSGERGLAYNPMTTHLLLVSRETGNNKIVILNSTDGSSNGLMSITGVITSGTGIQFLLNYIDVAADGVIYATDLAIPAAGTTNNFILYRWANEAANPTIAYQGPIGSPGIRYGDSLAVTGSGVNTMLASGANTGGGVVVLTTTDGMSFIPNNMTNTGFTSGDMQPGLDFYSATSFYCKHSGASAIHYSTFNLGTTPPTSMMTTTNTVNANYGPLKVSVSSNWVVCLNTQSGGSDSGHYVSLFNIEAGGNLTYVTSNALPANAGSGNGNAVGSVAINGSNVYVLDTDNAIEAFAIMPVAALVPPTVTVAPASETEYVGNPGFTFTATATGSLPVTYQWFLTSNSVTSSISGATNSTYAFAPATTNMQGSYSVSVSNGAGTNVSGLSTLTVQMPFTTGRMSNIWSLQPGSRFYLDNASYAQRGLAYDPVTGDLLVASRFPTNLIAVLNSTTGADEWLMNVDPSVITTANVTYPLNVIGVGGDGVVYGVPLVVAGQTGFQLYVWNDDTPASGPELAYNGTDPGNGSFQRWGDSMDVTGSGGDTMILLGTASATNIVSVLTSSDGGFTFNSTVLTVTDPNNASLVGFAGLGVAWGTNNTFWTKSTSYNLRQISYNLAAGTATVLNNYSTPFQGTQGNGLGVDVHDNLLSILAFDNPPSVRLYDIWFTVQNPNVTPVLVDQQLFAVNNPNLNFTAVALFASPYLYALDSNNGIEAYKVDTSTLLPYSMGVPVIQGADTLLTWQSQPGRAYQVEYDTNLTTPWVADGAPFASTTNSTSFTDTHNPTGTNGFFQVNGH